MIKEERFNLNDDTILATYQGHTVFSIFLYRLEAYENLLEDLSSREFDEQLNILHKPAENSFLRRLYRIINMPTADLKINSGKLRAEADFNCRGCILNQGDGAGK